MVVVGARVTQMVLYRERAAHRVDGTVELREKRVALVAGKSTLMSPDRRFDYKFDAIAEPGMGTLLVDAHQAAVPDHIRDQDRCQPPFQKDALHEGHPLRDF